MVVEVLQGEVADVGTSNDDFDAGGGYFLDYLRISVCMSALYQSFGKIRKEGKTENAAPSPHAPPRLAHPHP